MTLRHRVVLGPSFVSLFLLTSSARAQTPPTAQPVAPRPEPVATAPQDRAPSPSPPVVVLPPQPTPSGPVVELTSLRMMLQKGIITQAEYDSAMFDIGQSTGSRAADSTTSLVVGKWSTTIYGFAETDVINDSTQSFSDIAGNALVLRPNGLPLAPGAITGQNLYPANHGRTQMSVRNSRLGLRFRAPETHGVRASGFIETDFEGYLPQPNATTGPTESQFFTSPTLRVRHAVLKVETPVVDVLIGQYWDLFGWQGIYHPNTVQIQGIVGELYARDPQIRLSHAFRSKPIDVEIAVAARRPPSRDSQIPEGQGGLRFAFPWWTGVMTNGATATTVQPASIGVSGDVRQLALGEFADPPTRTVSLTTEALAVDAFIPIIPQKHTTDGNALSISGEIVTGSGMSDLYTGLNFGLTFPYLPPNPNINVETSTSTASNYPQDIDNGMVTYDLKGALHAIQLTSYLIGLQYYLPGLGGHVWISGNFARLQTNNIAEFTRNPLASPTSGTAYFPSSATVRQAENFFDANVFWDIVYGARVGFEYANFNDRYVDGVHAINNRFQGSAYFIF